MGRIQSSVGLITGVPIAETVKQLLAISSQPRDRLVTRTQGIQQQQVAVADLTAAVIGLQLAADNLGKISLFEEASVQSSDLSLLTVKKTGSPALGSYQFTPIRRASNHQLLSSGFSSRDEALGISGSLSLQFGGFVDKGVELADLNSGEGVQRGKIRITDRSGSSAVVDLRYARNIDDVLKAINENDEINVTASVEGDALRLVDNTSSSGNLRVQEVGVGSTATDLGLAGIDVAADSVVGGDVFGLSGNLRLDRLNDGNGVQFLAELPDLDIQLSDGSGLQIDFGDFSTAAANARGVTSAANGGDAELTFSAVSTGGDYDDVTIRFVDDAGVVKGGETVVYDDTDPDNKTLTFNIDAGQSDANDIVAALAGDVTASQVFTAQAGGDGSGVISVADLAVTSGGAAVSAPSNPTLSDLLRVVNQQDFDRLEARLSADGDGIELIDKTSGAGAFTVDSGVGGTTAEDLGLTGAAVAGVITSRRLASGLKGVLLSTLNGGEGLELGQLSLTDRAGASATVDLSAAETLQDVIDLVNDAGVGIEASVNDARNGLSLRDTSGGTGNLVVANADATNSADLLGLTANKAVSTLDGGSLKRQVVSESTQLASLNSGQGIDDGSFKITDANGAIGSVNFGVSEPKSIGDVLDLINGLSLAVEARINDAGDGIVIIDTSGGGGQIQIDDAGSGTTAADLGIAGASVLEDIDGTPTQAISGSLTQRITISSGDTLDDIIQRINDLDADINASVFNEGSGQNPFRLSLISGVAGSAGELLVDASDVDFGFQEIAAAEDALLLVGGSGSSGVGVLAASSSNEFDGVLEGVSLTVQGESDQPVTVTVDTSDEQLLSKVQLFVDQYNKLFEKLDEYTFFNELDQSTGVLFGSSEALRVESTITNLVTGSFFGVGSIRALAEVGISVSETGSLSLDEESLQNRFASDPEAVKQFFTDEDLGVASKLHSLIESLAGEGNSLLVNRNLALQAKIDLNNERIGFMNSRLERERETLEREFFALEATIAKLQANQTALQSLQPIPPLVSTNG